MSPSDDTDLGNAIIADGCVIATASEDIHVAIAPFLLTAKQAAELFSRTTRTLRNWERRGWLQPIRVGRAIFFRRADIESLVEFGMPISACQLATDAGSQSSKSEPTDGV